MMTLSRVENLMNRFLSKKEAKNREEIAEATTKEYESYMRRYAKDNIGHEKNLLNMTQQHRGKSVEPREMEYPGSDEDREAEEKVRKSRKGLRGVYRNITSYNDAMKNMCQRDIVRLTRNRNAVQELYANEENWLRQMKSQVANRAYGFSKKLF